MTSDLLPYTSSELTPPEIVAELDRFIISQGEAKKAVAVALRNRWRRLRVPKELKEEITPKNILMMGPTGVGKTEISRRLAKLAKAPFVKVEATKFTEVGYVGRDVESIIRDLAEVAYGIVKEEARERVEEEATQIAEERILDLLLPGSDEVEISSNPVFLQDTAGVTHTASNGDDSSPYKRTRERFRLLLREGKLEERIVEFEATKQFQTQMQILGPQGLGEIEGQIKDMFSNMLPKQREAKRLPVSEARKHFIQEAQESLISPESLASEAKDRVESTGIVFLDEVDKICGSEGTRGPDVSREGVQRDLLPIVEGSTVSTKFGPIKTDHILFIASGAFHSTKPSDLMPEFQGRFPIRVELKSLTPKDFVRILKEPENALIKQYTALLETEGVNLIFSEDAIEELAEYAFEVNSRTENIGARRLHTLLEKLLQEISFSAHESSGDTIRVDREYVREHLAGLVENVDLSRFML